MELHEPQLVRDRARSDFFVEYKCAVKIDDDEKSSEKSTTVGSWADESEDERENVIGSVDQTVHYLSPEVQCWPVLPMMPCMVSVNCFVPGSPPASPAPSLPSEAPILPKPVRAHVVDGGIRTTVMFRNMPNNYTRKMLLELMDAQGFAGQYDFVYLPVDFDTRACLGYAFINMVDVDAADRFWSIFNGFSSWSIPSRKVAGVSWSGPHQGMQAHVERYRNSSIMSDSTPDDYKPIILNNGVRLPFPAPTRKLRASRPTARW